MNNFNLNISTALSDMVTFENYASFLGNIHVLQNSKLPKAGLNAIVDMFLPFKTFHKNNLNLGRRE